MHYSIVSHHYLRVGKRYFLANQDLPGTLAAPVHPYKHVGLRDSLRLLLHQLGIRKGRYKAVELPVPGDVCMPAQRGYTVFRFEKKTVVQVFTPQVKKETFQGHEAIAKRISRLSFGPKVLDVSAEEQWLEVEYLPGKEGRTLLASDSRGFLQVFQSRLLPCLTELAMSEPLEFIPLREYVCRLLPSLEDESLAEWPEVQRQLRAFVQSQKEMLLKSDEIALSFSHGDFVHVNLIDTRNGLRVIDWDTAGWHSLLHDTHTFFFSQLHWRRDIPMSPTILEQALRAFVSALPATHAISLTPQTLDVYRRVYYLERLAMVLRRKKNQSRTNHLRKSILIHEAFEQEIPTGNAPCDQ